MEYTIKVPAIQGDTCNLGSVAEAMAVKRATSAGGEWDEKTFDVVLAAYSIRLKEAACSGQLITCNSLGIPTPWEALMGQREPEDVTLACCLAWVNLDHLNKWARDAGHSFTIQSEGVAWIDHRGVVGGKINEPLTLSLDENTYLLSLKHHKAQWPEVLQGDGQDRESTSVNQDAYAPTGPKALSTSDIAESFAGLAGRDYPWWKKRLGQMPKWLESCLVTEGSRGGPERRWNPIGIGMSLVMQGKVKSKSVRARFQTHEKLKPWLTEWLEQETHCTSE